MYRERRKRRRERLYRKMDDVMVKKEKKMRGGGPAKTMGEGSSAKKGVYGPSPKLKSIYDNEAKADAPFKEKRRRRRESLQRKMDKVLEKQAY